MRKYEHAQKKDDKDGAEEGDEKGDKDGAEKGDEKGAEKNEGEDKDEGENEIVFRLVLFGQRQRRRRVH
ncbi:MAG: hypothetical protein MPK06_03485 [Alphaproteobacteria bacterium]|nr:hypothetical protein [Alphaproteobacteria bacterium]MDA8004098.1 hypothetical protein [Alphaproteobacteria bacterium]MDA8005589.1 hypothetical protein [Alphaproteobacteria bacterium]MDA8013021.1 hypothetical protein [Alphaproteobacteria bacterium]